MNTIAKRYPWIGGAFCLAVIALIVGVLRPKHASSTDVMVESVQQKDVILYSEWIGTLDGFENAAVRAQVTCYFLRQAYQEGALVQKGQLLFEFDPRPFQAVLDQAEGQLAQATAQLANAEVVQVRTRLDVERYTPLAKEQAASQHDLDNATQNNLAAIATVETAKAQSKRQRCRRNGEGQPRFYSASRSDKWNRLTSPASGRRPGRREQPSGNYGLES